MASRIETDSMGNVEVAEGRYWGAQTQRSLENFKIGGQRFGRPVIAAFGAVKMAAAIVNRDLGKLIPRSLRSSSRRRKVIAGELDGEFPLVVWQTGSGTQTNMNANEVIANRAIELGGGVLGARRRARFTRTMTSTCQQSSNDVFPTAMHIAAALAIHGRLVPAVRGLRDIARAKERGVRRRHEDRPDPPQDATPLALGQEISGWVAQVDHCASTPSRRDGRPRCTSSRSAARRWGRA